MRNDSSKPLLHRLPQADWASSSVIAPAIIFSTILTASLFGILTRPVGFLAAFWPANAILLGLMVRKPQIATPMGWLAAFLGFCVGDLLTGSNLITTVWLTLANLAGVGVGFALFQQLSREDRHLQRPLSVLYLFAICCATGVASALVGGGASVILFKRDIFSGYGFWFTTELVNNILLLPAMLTFPGFSRIRPFLKEIDEVISRHPSRLAPALALLLSGAVSVLVGGPGAIVFPAPALLWCALTYRLFTTSVLTMLICSWKMIAVSIGVLNLQAVSGDYLHESISIRLGIALLALGPLTAASINEARNELLRSLDHAVSHDSLTDALARGAFMRRGANLLQSHYRSGPFSAVLMMDIDHFKDVNDRHGHAAGDQVLIEFSSIVTRVLRNGDLFGRLGGEEFAAILPQVNEVDALMIAERLRREVQNTPIVLESGEEISITVSIGLISLPDDSSPTLESLLKLADVALYEAKASGRNQVVLSPAVAA